MLTESRGSFDEQKARFKAQLAKMVDQLDADELNGLILYKFEKNVAGFDFDLFVADATKLTPHVVLNALQTTRDALVKNCITETSTHDESSTSH